MNPTQQQLPRSRVDVKWFDFTVIVSSESTRTQFIEVSSLKA